MAKIINTIKKSFVYIVGFLFFIIAMYVMLIPPNCKLRDNKKGIVEAFIGNPDYRTSKYDNIKPVTTKNMDSITAYRNIIGQNLNDISVFDSYIKNNITIIPDIKKALILSRCYQMPTNSTLIKQINSNKNSFNNIFISYAERYDYINNTDFGDIIQQKIVSSINTFIQTLTNISISNNNALDDITQSIKNVGIDGNIYVLVLQYPLFKDNSTKPEENITITTSILPQSKNNPDTNPTYYSPSYIAPISNKTKSSTVPIITSTPINYTIFVIYDDYQNGPNNAFGTIRKVVGDKFSNKFKPELDKTSLSTAEQCFIGGMGAGGLNYVGGCASLGGIAPNNFPFCGSPIPGDQSPWSYLMLYTVNKQVIGQSSTAIV